MKFVDKALGVAVNGQIPFESKQILINLCEDEKNKKALMDGIYAASTTAMWYGYIIAGVVCLGGIAAAGITDSAVKKFKLWMINRRIDRITNAVEKLHEMQFKKEETPEETEDEDEES